MYNIAWGRCYYAVYRVRACTCIYRRILHACWPSLIVSRVWGCSYWSQWWFCWRQLNQETHLHHSNTYQAGASHLFGCMWCPTWQFAEHVKCQDHPAKQLNYEEWWHALKLSFFTAGGRCLGCLLGDGSCSGRKDSYSDLTWNLVIWQCVKCIGARANRH